MRIFRLKRKNFVLITPHQGLGDHILCNGIYREYANQYKLVLITVKKTYRSQLSRMLSDLNNVKLISMPISRSWTTTRIIQLVAKLMRIEVIGLGSYGERFFLQGVRFDHNFYMQAGISFRNRWDAFVVKRDLPKELKLYNALNCNGKKYVFLHEDISRNFLINKDYLPNDIDVITPSGDPDEFNIFDYRMIIDNATEIHVIESAFAAYIESLDLTVPLFSHRYARPHALNDFRHEFTYRKKWHVLISNKK